MLDIKRIRENAAAVKAGLELREPGKYAEMIDEVVNIDEERRKILFTTEELKSKQNKVSKEIPAKKKAGEDTTAIFAEMKLLSDEIKAGDQQIADLELRQRNILMSLPNMPSEFIPVGKDESENVEIRKWGEPKKFDFEAKAHWDIGKDLGILDPETAGKVTGARFHFYRGLGARLERSVINYYLNTHTEHGYTEILPPFMVNRASMTGTGQLPKFEEDAFHLDGMDYFLIPTAEVPVTNMYRDDILEEGQLPLNYCAYSPCFRSEAGSAGRDQRGLIRQHQFNKVELVKFSRPEDSYHQLEALTADAERVLQGLGLPYRVVALCSGDIGFSSAKTYDIEVWMPSYNRYVEISSCSNFEDFQARRASIRYRASDGKVNFVHTLNGSGVAIGRTVAAILENYQQADGSVEIPEALKAAMGVNLINL